MRIVGMRAGVLRVPLRRPFRTAVRSVAELVDLVVRVETEDGLEGWGSAPPTAKVTGETLGSIRGALEELCPLLRGRDALDLEGNLDLIEEGIKENGSAKAALDVALHDLWGKALGQPLWRLFGGTGRPVETDITVSVNEPEEMARDARWAVEAGYGVLKIKVGDDPAKDLRRLSAVREAAGPGSVLRIDANQGWSPAEAIRILRGMEAAGLEIELVEQPVAARDLEGMARVRAGVSIPVVADESVRSPRDALEVLRRGAADMVNVKLMKCGGLRNARRIVAISRTFGAEVMLGSMLEGKASAAAAVHLASASRAITRIDIDGPLLCLEDPFEGGPLFEGPRIVPGDGPGTGIRGIRDEKVRDDGLGGFLSCLDGEDSGA
jgi:L-alanine-DL-glutamate epimerase-like enolase superfamily enzyme